jgi:hypothetical protein
MSEGGWRDAALGVAFIWVVALLAVALAMGRELQLMNARLGSYAAAQSVLDSDITRLRSENRELRDEIAEFQKWRVHVTLAARMGWTTANRYIQQYPLEMGQ